jgi:hypothetical protein
MSKGRYNLDYIIKKSFKEIIEYFNKNCIKVEDDLKLIIVESAEELKQKYGEIKESTTGMYNSRTKEIYIIKSSIKNFVDRIRSNLNEISISNIFIISRNGVLWPVPINNNNIEKIIAKADAESTLIHEIAHALLYSIGSNDEWKASFIEFLVYFYKNELYKYSEVYEIMEENTKRCEKFIQEKNPSPYSLGYCFANDIIYAYENILNKNKESPKLNIKDMIEKLKFFYKDYYVEITRTYNMALSDYIDTAKTLNAKYAMLSWITNCLLEKHPNMTNNI